MKLSIAALVGCDIVEECFPIAVDHKNNTAYQDTHLTRKREHKSICKCPLQPRHCFSRKFNVHIL